MKNPTILLAVHQGNQIANFPEVIHLNKHLSLGFLSEFY